MPRKRRLKYEDAKLQALFISELRKLNVPHTIGPDGAVLYWMRDNNGLQSATQKVRDAQFRWYFIHWDFEAGTAEFRRLLDAAGLRFVVELSDDGTWFLLPRADESAHEEISIRAFDSALVLQAAIERQHKRRAKRRRRSPTRTSS